ncbi:MAG: DUF4013 domain-containing protein, partial [Methanospirillum sp.]|nr:DUF4013 domain-containing protein [Methanospirillum sp.]
EIAGILIGSTAILVGFLIAFLITLVMNMAIVHFSRTGKLSDAFSIGSITRVISEGIGWGQYLVLWIITWILLLILIIILTGLSLIPVLGWLAGVILAPLWAVFIAKIYANIYDNRP